MEQTGRPKELLVLPILTVLVLAFSVWSSGGSDELRFARVYAGPTEGPSMSGRVQVVVEAGGLERGDEGRRVVVALGNPEGTGREHATEVVTGADGWADFTLAYLGPAGSRRLSIVDGPSGRSLAAGKPELLRERWVAAAERRGGLGAGHRTGNIEVTARLDPPVLSVPFGGVVTVTAPAGARLSARMEGLALTAPLPETMPSAGVVAFGVRAVGHVATLAIDVERASGKGGWFSPVPVVPGSAAVERANDEFVLRLPVERAHAYYAVVGPWGRGAGGTVRLAPAGDGTSAGRVALELPQVSDRYLFVSSAPDGRSPAAVGLPLDGQPLTFDAVDAFLLDGGALARAEAGRRTERRRFVLACYVGLAGALTLLAFVLRLRAADRDLRRRLEAASGSRALEDRRAGPALLAVISLFFAFSLGVLWILAR